MLALPVCALYRSCSVTHRRKCSMTCAPERWPILCIAGLARLPQMSLPLAKLDGCPLGLSLIAARGNDTLLLELAAG